MFKVLMTASAVAMSVAVTAHASPVNVRGGRAVRGSSGHHDDARQRQCAVRPFCRGQERNGAHPHCDHRGQLHLLRLGDRPQRCVDRGALREHTGCYRPAGPGVVWRRICSKRYRGYRPRAVHRTELPPRSRPTPTTLIRSTALALVTRSLALATSQFFAWTVMTLPEPRSCRSTRAIRSAGAPSTSPMARGAQALRETTSAST